MVSAKSLSSDIRTGLEIPISIYMTKPVDYLDLKKAVGKVLGT
jgi:DNA-binding response OmpR family regulator